MKRLGFLLLVMLVALASTSSLHASEIELRVRALVDPSPSDPTAPVRVTLVPHTDAGCSVEGTCRTRSAFFLQIAPCPPDLDACVGSFAFYAQNRLQAEFFDPIELELLRGVTYTIVGEWQVQRWAPGPTDCDQLVCDQTLEYEYGFEPGGLVSTEREDWSSLKARW